MTVGSAGAAGTGSEVVNENQKLPVCLFQEQEAYFYSGMYTFQDVCDENSFSIHIC